MVCKENIKQALTSTAEFLDDIEDQVIKLMNRGKTLNFIIHKVELKKNLMELPWLKPVYDDPEFLIRMIWRRYGGWWEGEYDRLFPAKRSVEASLWIDLVGSLDVVITKAIELSNQNEHRLAAHLIETAFYSDPSNSKVHEARDTIYANFSKEQTSSMGRNILNHASLASKEGLRDLAEQKD